MSAGAIVQPRRNRAALRLNYDRIGELGPKIKRAAGDITASIGGEVPEKNVSKPPPF